MDDENSPKGKQNVPCIIGRVLIRPRVGNGEDSALDDDGTEEAARLGRHLVEGGGDAAGTLAPKSHLGEKSLI